MSCQTLVYNGILVPVRTSFGLRRRSDKTYNYQRRVDVDMLNTVKSVLADVSSVSPSSEQKRKSKLISTKGGSSSRGRKI